MSSLQAPTELNDIAEKLNTKILPRLLPEAHFASCKFGPKVIHDNLWESCHFYAWEIALIDTHLLQRLRFIHQLGTASFTYPSAVHNRFSHSLGVATLAGQVFNALSEREPLVQKPRDTLQRDLATVRLAGLLHDIGHTFFSHCSELAMKPFWSKIFKFHFQNKLSCKTPKPHEFISYLILTSDYFRYIWEKYIVPIEKQILEHVDIEEVALMIIGAQKTNERQYMTSIINGPYDVDKLEYLHRDAKTAGLAITYDRARYFQKIVIHRDATTGTQRLAMGHGGVQSVEQMAISKMMLFPYVYHHHKVLVSDMLVQDIIAELISPQTSFCSIKIDNPIDMLLYNDADILACTFTSNNTTLNRLVTDLQSRRLNKRCFIAHREYMDPPNCGDDNTSESHGKLRDACSQIPNRQAMRKDIAQIINSRLAQSGRSTISEYDVSITMPAQVQKLDETKTAPVIGRNNECHRIEDYWLLAGWQDVHESKRDYIYFHAPEFCKEDAHCAVAEYIKDKFKITYSEGRVKEHCKMSPQ